MIVIAGPTAVGKTTYSLQLAKLLDCPIISADSRQIFRELKIGTARLEDKEMQGIRHYMLGTIGLNENYNVGRYEKEVLDLLEKLFEKHNRVILTGGTGLYIKAITEGLDHFPDVPETVRNNRQKQFESVGIAPLLEELKVVDPEYFDIVDRNNPARVIRALAVRDSSGQPFSSFRSGGRQKRSFRIHAGWLNLPKTLLHQRINERVDQMIAEGLLKELSNVIMYREKQALNTVGYKELIDYLDGKTGLDEAIELIKLHTRQYAKRQITWFRKYIPGPEMDARDTTSLDQYYMDEP